MKRFRKLLETPLIFIWRLRCGVTPGTFQLLLSKGWRFNCFPLTLLDCSIFSRNRTAWWWYHVVGSNNKYAYVFVICTMCKSSSSSSSSSSFSSVSVSLQQHVSTCVSQVHHESYSVSNICGNNGVKLVSCSKNAKKKARGFGPKPIRSEYEIESSPGADYVACHHTFLGLMAGGAGWWLCCKWSTESEIFFWREPLSILSTFAIHCGSILWQFLICLGFYTHIYLQ